MKKILLSFVAAVCCMSLSAAGEGRTIDGTLSSGGIERSYKIYIPDDMAAHRSLVVVLHGYGGSADPARFDMNRAADRYGFAVCYPQGERDGRGKRCWNVGYPFQADMTIDDVGFLCELAGHLQKTYGLSAENTFCTGLSNGGEMCYLLAYTRGDVFRAVAPVAGLTLESMYRTLSAARAVPLMEIHGTADRTSLWEGDPDNSGGWGAYLSVPVAVGYWVAADRCTHCLCDTVPSRSERLIVRDRYVGGTDGAEVWLYRIEGGKHSWGEPDMDTPETIWEFFSKFVAERAE